MSQARVSRIQERIVKGSEETVKSVYSYSEVGARIEQRTKTIFTRSAQVRVSVMKPSGKSHTIKVSINLLIGSSSIGSFSVRTKTCSNFWKRSTSMRTTRFLKCVRTILSLSAYFRTIALSKVK